MKQFICLLLAGTPIAASAGFLDLPVTSFDFTEESYTDDENILGFYLGDYAFSSAIAVDALGSSVAGFYGTDVIPGPTFAGSLASATYGVYLIHMDIKDAGVGKVINYAAEVDFGAEVLGVAFSTGTFAATANVLEAASSLEFIASGTSNFSSGNDKLRFSNASTLDFLNGVTEVTGVDGQWMNQAFLFFEQGADISPSVVPEPSVLLGALTTGALGLLFLRRRR